MDTASANDCNIYKSLKLVKGWSSITSEEEDGAGGEGTAILRKLRRFSNLRRFYHRSFLEITYKTGEAKEQGAQIYHFTQIVWKTTKKLGMATAVSGGRRVAVARYSPVGNWLGEFKENVLPPKKV